MSYNPVIIVRIPADIAVSEHAAITAEIAALNSKLSAQSYQAKTDAEGRAAVVLGRSNVGACGYASARKA